MAKGNGSPGNKYARRIKNQELIGKGEVKSVQQILKDGPQMSAGQKAQQIIAQKEKGQ